MNKVDLINESCNKIKHKSNTVSSPRQLRTSCQVKHISFLLVFPLDDLFLWDTAIFNSDSYFYHTHTHTHSCTQLITHTERTRYALCNVD